MSPKYEKWEDWASKYYGQLVGYTIKEFKIEDKFLKLNSYNC